jgi:hypothetical protein
MIKIEEILAQWKIDCVIDELAPHKSSVEAPILHAKYLDICTKYKFKSNKTLTKYNDMKKIRREYYLGNLDKETLDEYSWEPFELKVGSKSNIEIYLEADPILSKLLETIFYCNECVSTCNSIMKELNARSFQIKNWIEYQKFLAGN